MDSLESTSDQFLFQEIKKGNKKAFNTLFETHWDGLYQAAYKVLLSEDMAKDAVQEVFFDLWLRKLQLEVENIPGFLYKAVRNQSLKQLRKNAPLQIHEDRFKELLVNTTQEQLDLIDLKTKLGEKLGALSPREREIFEMSRYQNLSNKEIANHLNLSQRTVEWYLYQVVKELKTALTVSVLVILSNLFY
ncbi:sigma-70 family RNA polymerase sigma factor [Flagellimonas marinaquae]|uniref:sigma-70 family RNA polymerase sigma factor n=1 Tax=Flagellimonas aurea TaxID=2915619 RepID=UPI001CE0F030|nr:sigma-70 family RNA polymerase sigma factor [Allomuricauda aquimarina]